MKNVSDKVVIMSNSQDLHALRHSAAHLLAHAVSELYPQTQLTIGPITDDGFFYDFLPATNFKETDLPLIEQRMHEIAKRDLPITQKELPKADARHMYANNPFKLELIDQIPGDTVGIASQGEFHDLCKGGHVKSTGMIKHFKLMNISGSYWRADKAKQALQRISGTAFFTAKELEDFEKRLEDLILFDHRRLGKQLDLFSFHDEGAGFPFFHPKGAKVLAIMQQYMRKQQEAHHYQEICTPTMLTDELWRRSGHYAHYRDKMYFCKVDEQSYAIKPMNCPGAILTYQTRPRSYRELPLKLAEYGHVHRHELSGVLHGLMRVRAFTIDDAHIFCTPDQLEQEISVVIKLMQAMLKTFGFEKYAFALATRPEQSTGSDDLWNKATNALKHALESLDIPYVLNEGEGAFYGPKIELDIEDSMQRHWQCGTVQVDFSMPESFDLAYIAPSGKRERPVIIHQAIFGSLERFFAILLEHYKGQLPFWLAPIQARVLPITDEQHAYAQSIREQLQHAGIRTEVDLSSDPLNAQIKNAQLEKIPWMLIVGKKEMAQQMIAVRHLDGTQEPAMSLASLIEKAQHLQP
jgi:threonyl-tRNA synthetase